MQLLTITHIESMRPGALVSNYLMASYTYEHMGEVYMTDAAYDRLCKRLSELFHLIDHQHKHLIDEAALQSTTGFYLKPDQLPRIIKDTAAILVEKARTDQLFEFSLSGFTG